MRLAWYWDDKNKRGILCPEEELPQHPKEHGRLYADEVFEGIRKYGDALFRLDDHLKRLWRSAAIYELDPPIAIDALAEACVLTMAANAHLGDNYLRPEIYTGVQRHYQETKTGGLGIDPTNCPIAIRILTDNMSGYLTKTGIPLLNGGIILGIDHEFRREVSPRFASAKAVPGYAQGSVAKRQATKLGWHDTLLLAPRGDYISECTGMNIVLVTKSGRLLTPDVISRRLAGITLQTIKELKGEQQLIEKPIEVWELLEEAEEVFVTGTAAEIAPVTAIFYDGRLREIGSGHPGPITQELQDFYHRIVTGQFANLQHLLTPIHLVAESTKT